MLVDTVQVSIEQSTFDNNMGQSGGAFCVMPNGTATLTDSTVRDNSATNGAGIYNAGTSNSTRVTISGNLGSHGGGINNFGSLVLNNATLSGNQATYGGGLDEKGDAVWSVSQFPTTRRRLSAEAESFIRVRPPYFT